MFYGCSKIVGEFVDYGGVSIFLLDLIKEYA